MTKGSDFCRLNHVEFYYCSQPSLYHYGSQFNSVNLRIDDREGGRGVYMVNDQHRCLFINSMGRGTWFVTNTVAHEQQVLVQLPKAQSQDLTSVDLLDRTFST